MSRLSRVFSALFLLCIPALATDWATWLGSTLPRWGFCEQPLVDGDRVIINPGGKGAGIVALNKVTGVVMANAG